MNREQRRRMKKLGLDRYELVTVHCGDCGAPYCPECDSHMTECPDCGGFHCEGCGYWLGQPVGPHYEVSAN